MQMFVQSITCPKPSSSFTQSRNYIHSLLNPIHNQSAINNCTVSHSEKVHSVKKFLADTNGYVSSKTNSKVFQCPIEENGDVSSITSVNKLYDQCPSKVDTVNSMNNQKVMNNVKNVGYNCVITPYHNASYYDKPYYYRTHKVNSSQYIPRYTLFNRHNYTHHSYPHPNDSNLFKTYLNYKNYFQKFNKPYYNHNNVLNSSHSEPIEKTYFRNSKPFQRINNSFDQTHIMERGNFKNNNGLNHKNNMENGQISK